MLLLDTSVAVELREGGGQVARRMERLDRLPVLSIISVVELDGGLAGAVEGRESRRAALDRLYTSLEILPFGEPEAAAYRQIIEALGFARRLIIDRMIAAQALVAGATLATLNPRDFRGIPELKVDDWSA